MAVNKVEFGGDTLIDLTGDSVTPETMVKGTTAHNRAGEQIEGTFDPDIYQTKEDTTLGTTDKTIVGAINEVNGKTADNIKGIYAIEGNRSLWLVGEDGIIYQENAGLYKDAAASEPLGSATIVNRVPIVAGNNVEFEEDYGNGVVKINATGGGGTSVYQATSVDELPSDAVDGSLAIVTTESTEEIWVLNDELDNLGESYDAWYDYNTGICVSPFTIKYSSASVEYDGFSLGTQGSSTWGIYTLNLWSENSSVHIYTHNPSGNYGITHGWINGDVYKTITVKEADEEATRWLEAHATKGGEGGTNFKSTLYAKVNGEWVNVSSGGSGGSSDNSNGLEMPQIRFANFQDTNGSMCLSEENPFKFTVEVVGGGALREGDLLQICARRKSWYRVEGTSDFKQKWKLRQQVQREITSEDIGKRFLEIEVDIQLGAFLFHNDRWRTMVSTQQFMDTLSYIYFRIKRVTKYDNDGMECDAIFSNVEKVAKTYKYQASKLTIK